jgi:hypothetical protein
MFSTINYPNNLLKEENMLPKNRRATHSEFVEQCRIKGVPLDEYTFLSEYPGMSNKITIQHNIEKCNHIFEMKCGNFLNLGQRCPKCAKNEKITYEDLISYYKKYGYEIVTPKKEYTNTKQKINSIHLKCGNTFNQSVIDFRRGYRCSACSKNKNIDLCAYHNKHKRLNNHQKQL